MTSTTMFADPYEERMTVTAEFTNDRASSLHIKINPKEYFYPYIYIGSDGAYDEEEGITYEQFQWQKTIAKMLDDNSYKKIFRERFAYGLNNFLRAVQAEAELEFKEGEPLENKVANNEEIIFELVKKKGPGIFRYNAVIEKVRNWCNEKDYQKIKKLTIALKEYGKSFYGSVPFSSFEKRYYFIIKYKEILENVRALKKDINARRKKAKSDKKLENEIIEKWAHESTTLTLQNKHWFELLLGLAKRKQEKTGIGFISFIKTNSPRWLAIRIFRDIINLSYHSIDKIIRDKESIIKTMMIEYGYGEHRFWWHLDLE